MKINRFIVITSLILFIGTTLNAEDFFESGFDFAYLTNIPGISIYEISTETHRFLAKNGPMLHVYEFTPGAWREMREQKYEYPSHSETYSNTELSGVGINLIHNIGITGVLNTTDDWVYQTNIVNAFFSSETNHVFLYLYVEERSGSLTYVLIDLNLDDQSYRTIFEVKNNNPYIESRPLYDFSADKRYLIYSEYPFQSLTLLDLPTLSIVQQIYTPEIPRDIWFTDDSPYIAVLSESMNLFYMDQSGYIQGEFNFLSEISARNRSFGNALFYSEDRIINRESLIILDFSSQLTGYDFISFLSDQTSVFCISPFVRSVNKIHIWNSLEQVDYGGDINITTTSYFSTSRDGNSIIILSGYK